MYSIRNLEDAEKFQRDLKSVYEWAEESNMKFNGDKFQLLRYGEDETLKQSTAYTDCNGNAIEVKTSAKDLGIQMSSDASFAEHIMSVVQSASQMSGWVLRTFYTRERQPMLILYKTLILSKLDYCSALWNPHGSAYLVDKIETVQRSFTRKIASMDGLNYWERLQTLRLYSVQRRRERYMIMYVFKVLHRLVPNCGFSFHESARTGIRAVVPFIKSGLSSKLKTLKSNSFNHIAPMLYNILPRDMRIVYDPEDSFETFKKDLDIFLSTIPDQPTVAGLPRSAKSNSLIHQVPSYIV